MQSDQKISNAAADGAAFRRDRFTTVSLVVACQVVHALTFTGLSLLLPLVRQDLDISFSQAGILSAAGTLSYALGQIPAGYLSDRFGPRRLFFIGLLGWSVLSVCLGLIHQYWLAVANQFVAGAFRALLFAPGLSLLASWFPPERRATAMSLYMFGGFGGNLVLSLGGPLLVSYYGWRMAFILFAVLGVVFATLYGTLSKDSPRAAPKQQVSMLDVFQLFRYRIMWVCSGLQFVRFSVVTSFNVWLPSLLVSDRGLSVQSAGLVLAVSAAFTAPSNMLGSYVSDRLRNPPLVIGGALAVLACGSALLVLVDSLSLMLFFVAVNSVFLQFYFGPLFHVPVEVLGQRTAGTATGFSNLFANIGGVCTAWGLGFVRDRAGSFTWGFIGISVLCVCGIVLAFVLARMRGAALEQAKLRAEGASA